MEMETESVDDIVMSTCVLHNFLRKECRGEYISTDSVDQDNADGTVTPGQWREEVENMQSLAKSSQRNASEFAKKIRNNLADHFISREGQIPWQYDHVM